MANRWERARSGLLFLIDKFKLSDGTDTTMSLWLTNLLTPIVSRMTEFNNDSGTATGGSNTTLVDTTKVWQVDMWKHGKVEIIKGTKHYFADIISNTADTLTFAALAGGVIVAATEVYQIKAAVDSTDIKSWNGTALTGRDITQDYINIPKKATTPSLFMVTVAANTEGSQALPANTKRFSIKMSGGLPGDVWHTAWETGKVNPALVSPYDVHDGGYAYTENSLDLAASTIFFSTSKVGGATFIIEAWV